MKGKSISLDRDELIQLVGKEKAEEVLAKAHRVKLTKKDLIRIEDKLNKEGLVALKRTKRNPTEWQFVGHRFIQIDSRFSFEKPEILEKANSRNRLKTKTIHEVLGGSK